MNTYKLDGTVLPSVSAFETSEGHYITHHGSVQVYRTHKLKDKLLCDLDHGAVNVGDLHVEFTELVEGSIIIAYTFDEETKQFDGMVSGVLPKDQLIQRAQQLIPQIS